MANPTELYLAKLIEGSAAELEALFFGLPWIDDPLGPKVRESGDLQAFVGERHAWLTERAATVRTMRTTHTAHRAVTEAILLLSIAGTIIELPIAVAADLADDLTRVRAVRVYHSLWPLEGAHRVRPPLLPHDPTLHLNDVVTEYQRALASGDPDAILRTFESDGYFREPSGGDYVFRGPALREFMESLLGSGGIGLEHCAATDDGVACALEFNAVRFGAGLLDPQAGIAVYERGAGGRLAAARVYDDVNVEALAAR
jgi:SnoaL-like protein